MPLTDAQRTKLIAQKAKLTKQIEDMNLRPISRSQAGRDFDLKDKIDLAHKIVIINKKLGHEQS